MKNSHTPEEFDLLTEQARFVRAVQDGFAQADAGQFISDEALEKELDREFGPMPKKRHPLKLRHKSRQRPHIRATRTFLRIIRKIPQPG